jgi:Domain of unknown function (DUF4331)
VEKNKHGVSRRHLIERSSLALITLVLTAGMAFYSSSKLLASDHRDSPTADSNAQGDITDIFAFLDPNTPANLVLLMNVNPFAVPAELGYHFSTTFLYQFKIANGPTAVESLVIQAMFENVATATCASGQMISVYGPSVPPITGASNVLLNETPTVTGCTGVTLTQGTMQVFSGLRDDPFVADIGQLNRILNGSQDLFRAFPTSALGALSGRAVRSDMTSGVDGFGGFNVTTIGVELPASAVAGSAASFLGAAGLVGIWGTTSLPGPSVYQPFPLATPEPIEVGPKALASSFERVPTVITPSHEVGSSALAPALRRPNFSSQTYTQFQRVGQQLFKTVFVPAASREAFNSSAPVDDMTNWITLIPGTLTTKDNDGTGNTISGRAGLLTALGLTDASAAIPGAGHGAPLLLPATFGNTNPNLLQVALLPDVLRLDLNLQPTGILPGAAAVGGNGDPQLGLGAFGLQNGRRPADTVTDILLTLARQLADVNFPASTGVPGSGPPRANALNFATDPRVLAVLQGTDWIKTDGQVGNVSGNVAPYGGNDQPLLATFPFLAAPNPLPGDPGTVGFPPQQ